MPTMSEIYARYAPEYDELVQAEDADDNLPALLAGLATWSGSRVYEAGIGTGRITALYLEACRAAFGADRSLHMLSRAEQNLARYGPRLILQRGENLALPAAPWAADIFIEGWSFGHTLLDNHDDGMTTAALVAQAEGTVRPGGTVILIETLGTAVDRPAAPDERLAAFYERLEAVHGFSRQTIRTDYQFASVAEATRVIGFFFGQEMGARVSAAGRLSVMEWTGVWWKQRVGAPSSDG